MKRFVKFIVMAVVLVVGATTGRFSFTTAESAAVNCPEVVQCINEGYVMSTCEERPIDYLVQPDGEYNWGTVHIEMSNICAPPLTITCYIDAVMDDNGRLRYRETHNFMRDYVK